MPTVSQPDSAPKHCPSASPTPVPTPAPVATPVSGESPGNGALALRWVVYAQNGKAVIDEAASKKMVDSINTTWKQCNIQFYIKEYLAVDPSKDGLDYNTASMGDLDGIRKVFDESNTMLVVTTGEWSGSLGQGSANAWTNMPGQDLLGVVIENTVSDFPLIYAHELGHYLNLDHVSDSSNLMNPIIYGSSTNLDQGQCQTAKEAVDSYFQNMK